MVGDTLVGEFPGIQQPTGRRTIRAPVNPLDKSTIVSILPKFISERKATIQPGLFELHPGSFDNPFILTIGPSSWWREIDENQPLLEIPVSSIQVADSIVKDYCSVLLGCNMGDHMPGLFYLPGVFSAAMLKSQHMPLLINARENQKRWFLLLVKLADILWSRSNGNPLSISDDARLACKELNITNKPWLGDMQTAELVRCIACGNLRNPAYPICQSCHAIVDKKKAEELGLTFVKA
jgi:hypothetical protein